VIFVNGKDETSNVKGSSPNSPVTAGFEQLHFLKSGLTNKQGETIDSTEEGTTTDRIEQI